MKILFDLKVNISYIIQLALFFLISMNFFNSYYYLIFAAMFVCLVSNFRHLKVDIVVIILLAFSVCYIVFYPPSRNSLTTILKQFVYPMCYLVGFNLVNKKAQPENAIKNADANIKVAILVIAFGSFLHYILNAVTNFNSLFRNTIDFWTHSVLSATGQALLAVIGLSIFSVWLVMDSPLWKKIVSIVCLILIFAYNFVLAGRTIMILGLIIIAVTFLYTRKYTNTIGNIKRYIFLLIIAIALLVIFFNNIFGIRDWILDSNLANRFNAQNALEDVRLERKLLYFSHMFDFLIGGGHLKEKVGGFAHELFLDVYSDIGMIGYILVISIVVLCTINVVKLIKNKSVSLETRCLVLCVFMGILVVFFIEPIMQAAPWLFCVFCFLSGIVKNSNLIIVNENIKESYLL